MWAERKGVNVTTYQIPQTDFDLWRFTATRIIKTVITPKLSRDFEYGFIAGASTDPFTLLIAPVTEEQYDAYNTTVTQGARQENLTINGMTFPLFGTIEDNEVTFHTSAVEIRPYFAEPEIRICYLDRAKGGEVTEVVNKRTGLPVPPPKPEAEKTEEEKKIEKTRKKNEGRKKAKALKKQQEIEARFPDHVYTPRGIMVHKKLLETQIVAMAFEQGYAKEGRRMPNGEVVLLDDGNGSPRLGPDGEITWTGDEEGSDDFSLEGNAEDQATD